MREQIKELTKKWKEVLNDPYLSKDSREHIEICISELEQILSPNLHSTSCTYQFELAFLHLQDTPELRKMYWSALGQLQFDSNDQVITPELEQCACCEAGEACRD